MPILITIVFSLSAVSGAANAAVQPLSGSARSLDYFVGSWKCSGVFPASGKSIASIMHYEADLKGHALLKHHDDVAPSLYHAIEAWGYDAAAKRFNAAILDNSGGARRFSSEGWKRNELEWSSEMNVVPAQRFSYTRLDEKSYRVDWKTAANGTDFTVGDTLTCKRE